MSVHPVYSSADTARIKKARKKNPEIQPSQLTPKPRPTGWDVRWRQNGKFDMTSVRLLVAKGFSNKYARELDAKIARIKALNNGSAPRWMVLGDRTTESGTPTLEAFALGTFTEAKAQSLKPTTLFDYAEAIAGPILNVFRHMTAEELKAAGHYANRKVRKVLGPTEISQIPLDKIRLDHIIRWHTETAANGIGKRQLEKALEALSAILGYAAELNVIDRSPLHGTRALRTARRSKAEVLEVVPNSRVIDPVRIEIVRRAYELRGAMRDWMLTTLLAYEGLRPGEAVVLYFDELLDPKGNAREVLEIQRNLSRGVEVNTPKNGEWRPVKLFDPVRDAIERYYFWCGRPSLDLRAFPALGGNMLNPERINDSLARLAKIPELKDTPVGKRFRPYDLRHTAASLLSTGGDSAKPGMAWSSAECAEHLGHSVQVFGTIYQHVVGHSRYRGMPIEEVIAYGMAEALSLMPGVPRRDVRCGSPYWPR